MGDIELENKVPLIWVKIPIACTMVGKIKTVVIFTNLDLPESYTRLCV